MNQTPLLVPALGAVYAALAPWVEALLRFAVGIAMVPHGFRMCLGYFKGTGGPISSVPAVAAMYDRKGFRPAGKLCIPMRDKPVADDQTERKRRPLPQPAKIDRASNELDQRHGR